MTRSLNTAGTGMVAQQYNLDVISNNLANVNTTSYKQQRAEFQDLMSDGDGGRRALHLTEEIDDAEGVVASLQSLGDGHRLAGDHQTAREYLERGLAESRQHQLPYFTAHLLAYMAAVDLADGRLDEAMAHAK